MAAYNMMGMTATGEQTVHKEAFDYSIFITSTYLHGYYFVNIRIYPYFCYYTISNTITVIIAASGWNWVP